MIELIYFFKLKSYLHSFKLKTLVTSFSSVPSLKNKTKRIDVIKAIKCDKRN